MVAAASAEAPGGSGAYGAPIGGFQSQGNFGGNSFRGSSSGSGFGGFNGGAASGGYSGGSGSSGSFGGFGGSSSSGSFGGSSSSGSFGGISGGQQQGGEQDTAPKTFRYVSVHVAPEEPSTGEARQIRVPGGGNKHVNIIFVKTPSASGNQQTEVILPEQDQQKNLVYVLLKKDDSASNIKIRRPQAQAPKKPEVYFIRYKNEAEAQQALGGLGGQAGGLGGQGGLGGSSFGAGSSSGFGAGSSSAGGYPGGASQGSRPSTQYGIN